MMYLLPAPPTALVMKQPTASSLEPPGAVGKVSNLQVLLPSAPAVVMPAGTNRAAIVAISNPSRSRNLDFRGVHVELDVRVLSIARPPGRWCLPKQPGRSGT